MAVNYYSPSPPAATIGAPCGADGAAMYDEDSLTAIGPPWPPGCPTGPHCWRMTADPVIIGPSFMSWQQAVQTVNFDFSTNGDQPAVTNHTALPGPVKV